MTVNEAFPFTEGMTAAKANTGADNIQVMTSDGGYVTYFLSNGYYGKSGYNADLVNKWAKDGETLPTTETLIPGAGFWYLSRGAAAGKNHAIQVAGQVSAAAKKDYTINKTYTLIGSPYPAAIAINGGIEVTGSTAAKANTGADNIQIMTADGGYTTYFLSNGYYGKSGYNAELANKWAKDGETVPTTDKFPVGGGAWYLSRTANGTISFNSPIAE